MTARIARALTVAGLALLLAAMAVTWMACGEEADGAATTASTVSVASAADTAGSAPAAATPSSGEAPATSASATSTVSESSPVAPPPAVVPPAIAGISLSAWVDGDRARAEVEQLHGKLLGAGMEQAWLAQYGGGKATLWVTRAVDPADARDLYVRMVDRIAAGSSPFTAQQPIDVPGVEGYSLEGLGQVHYYFLVGGDLYWLAIDADSASTGLQELVAQAQTVAGVE